MFPLEKKSQKKKKKKKPNKDKSEIDCSDFYLGS